MANRPAINTEAAERIRVGSEEVIVHVASEATGGSLLAIEVTMPAAGGPPVLHRHAPEEVYRVERGELAIYVEDDDGAVRRIPTAPGAVVHIPGGSAHTVRNESDAEALAFVVFTPGADMERFMRGAGALRADGSPRMEDVVRLAGDHGIEILGPVGG
jgi:oxalate decarboxylase/phosphoglucose isomerase-like protein (cupin superfamily)